MSSIVLHTFAQFLLHDFLKAVILNGVLCFDAVSGASAGANGFWGPS